jgi:Lipocalin-like domain
MKRFRWLAAVTLPALLLGVLTLADTARSQTVNAQLIGSSWTLASAEIDRAGTKIRLSPPRLQGFLVFDGGDHFLVVIARSGSSSGQQQTAGQDQGTLHRTIACFGTYSVDEVNHTISAHIESSTLPKWAGTDQKPRFTITGGVLKWVNSSPSSVARTAELVWKRVK